MIPAMSNRREKSAITGSEPSRFSNTSTTAICARGRIGTRRGCFEIPIRGKLDDHASVTHVAQTHVRKTGLAGAVTDHLTLIRNASTGAGHDGPTLGPDIEDRTSRCHRSWSWASVSLPPPSRWWLLRLLGHRCEALLDGGQLGLHRGHLGGGCVSTLHPVVAQRRSTRVSASSRAPRASSAAMCTASPVSSRRSFAILSRS